MAKAENAAANADKMIKVTLVHSVNGCLDKQKKTVQAMGLRKIGSSRIVKDNVAMRGMIAVIPHLVSVEEVKA